MSDRTLFVLWLILGLMMVAWATYAVAEALEPLAQLRVLMP